MVLHAVAAPEAGLLTGPPPMLLGKWVQALKQAKREELCKWVQDRQAPVL